MGEEADLGVVAGGSGGDEELPVGGFEEQELAAELFHDAGALRGVAPAAGGADVAGVELGGVDVGVGPGGLGVHPDVVGAFCSPGAFVHGEESGAGVFFEVFGAGDELDAGLVVVEVAGYGFEPEGSFEPPVAEELGVEGGAEDGRDGFAEAFVEGLPDETGVVGGVVFDAGDGFLRVVGELVAHVYLGAGDAPVAVTAGPALFVEVEVDAVAGVSGVSGPYLNAGAGVAGEDGGGVTLVVGAVDEVGLVERAVVAVGHLLDGGVGGDCAVAELVGGWDAVTFFDEVGVDEEEVDVGLGEGLLDADAVEAGGLG